MKGDKGRRLYPLNCRKCGQLLCWAIKESETYCPRCQVWTAQEGAAAKKKAVTAR